MNRLALCLGISVVAVFVVGCGGRQRAEVFNGFVDVVGSDNQYRILPGSDVIRLQVVGDRNNIVVDDDAVLAELYILGKENTIELPSAVDPYGWWRGATGNRILHRPAPQAADVDVEIREYRMRLMIDAAPDEPAPASQPTAAPHD